MKKVYNNLFFVLLVVSAGINVYLIKLNNTYKNSLHEAVQMYISSSTEYNELQNDQQFEDSLEFFSQGCKINNISLYNIENKSSNTLQSIINGPSIIFYFNQYNCTSCYSSSFVEFKRTIEKYGIKNFKFFGNFNSINEFANFIRNNEIICDSYLISDTLIGLPLETSSLPFIFFTDSSLICQDGFLINKLYPEVNSNYIGQIHNKYFNNLN